MFSQVDTKLLCPDGNLGETVFSVNLCPDPDLGPIRIFTCPFPTDTNVDIRPIKGH